MPFRTRPFLIAAIALLLTGPAALVSGQETASNSAQSGRKSTLGMRFVSVPGTTVLFSVYETRVGEWNQFLRARKYPWTFEPHFKQDENHPVVGVNLQDAIAFVKGLKIEVLNDLQATTVMLSGNPADSARIRGHRFARAAAGRAMLFDDGDQPTHLQLVLVPDPVGSTQSHLRNHQGEEFGS